MRDSTPGGIAGGRGAPASCLRTHEGLQLVCAQRHFEVLLATVCRISALNQRAAPARTHLRRIRAQRVTQALASYSSALSTNWAARRHPLGTPWVATEYPLRTCDFGVPTGRSGVSTIKSTR